MGMRVGRDCSNILLTSSSVRCRTWVTSRNTNESMKPHLCQWGFCFSRCIVNHYQPNGSILIWQTSYLCRTQLPLSVRLTRTWVWWRSTLTFRICVFYYGCSRARAEIKFRSRSVREENRDNSLLNTRLLFYWVQSYLKLKFLCLICILI